MRFSFRFSVPLLLAACALPLCAKAEGAPGQAGKGEQLQPADFDKVNARAVAKVQAIAADCARNKKDCLRHFERYYRGNQDHRQAGALFGLLSAHKFWGTAEELHYTEVEAYPTGSGEKIEYQVGFGYQIAAREAGATMTGSGLVQSLSTDISGSGGGTRYWAILIGMTPDRLEDSDGRKSKSCREANTRDDRKSLTPAGELLCIIDMQPTVTEAYFRENSARVALAMDKWRKEGAFINSENRALLCPQVINLRYADRKGDARKIDEPTPEMFAKAKELNKALMATCAYQRPNLKIAYRGQSATYGWFNNQTRSDGKKVQDGGAGRERKSVSQEYFRSENYIFLTSKYNNFSKKYKTKIAKNRSLYSFENRDTDRRTEIEMQGVNSHAKLPSVLASIVSYERRDVSQHLFVKLYCGGGATNVAVADNPVANPIAFTELVEAARQAIDGSEDSCPHYTPAT